MTDEAIIAALAEPVEFPEKQINWIKTLNHKWKFAFEAFGYSQSQ